MNNARGIARRVADFLVCDTLVLFEVSRSGVFQDPVDGNRGDSLRGLDDSRVLFGPRLGRYRRDFECAAGWLAVGAGRGSVARDSFAKGRRRISVLGCRPNFTFGGRRRSGSRRVAGDEKLDG